MDKPEFYELNHDLSNQIRRYLLSEHEFMAHENFYKSDQNKRFRTYAASTVARVCDLSLFLFFWLNITVTISYLFFLFSLKFVCCVTSHFLSSFGSLLKFLFDLCFFEWKFHLIVIVNFIYFLLYAALALFLLWYVYCVSCCELLWSLHVNQRSDPRGNKINVSFQF